MSDAEILRNLEEVNGWRNVEMGADGNCLFRSIAPQISAGDVAGLPSRSPVWEQALGADIGESWEALAVKERAMLLRRIAILDEKEFIAQLADLCTRGEAVTPERHWRALELFKDMAEEFMSSGATELPAGVPWCGQFVRTREGLRATYGRVRQLARDTPARDVQDFVLKHAEEYMQITGCEGNWAGSSEMVALASALGRSFAAYGNNWISQDSVELQLTGLGQWEVLPYFEAPGAGSIAGLPPVRIFQTNGGGHYQMLSPG